MDKLDLIIRAIDDSNEVLQQRNDRLENLVREGFAQLNGRVRKVEGDIIRIKTIWTVLTVAVGIIYNYFFG